MTEKRKRRGRKPKRIDDGEIAAMLTCAQLHDDKTAAEKFSTSERTIQRWRKRVRDGKCQTVARLVEQARAKALASSQDLLVETFDLSLRALQKKLDALPGEELIEACKMLGELRQGRDFLNDGETGERGSRAHQSPPGDESDEGEAPSGARVPASSAPNGRSDAVH